MEQTVGRIQLAAVNAEINQLLQRDATDAAVSYTRHFNHSEDFFLRLARPYDVPAFPIHHDVHSLTPVEEYLVSLTDLIDRLQRSLPGVFTALTYSFDPTEILSPAFFQIFRVEERVYFYLLRLDLTFRPNQHETLDRGTNDRTARYRTRDLVVRPLVVPLSGIQHEGSRVEGVEIDRLIDETWIGETGRGYFSQGIWIDHDLTKFFSKLFIPPGKRLYPYFPFTSTFRTVCHTPLRLELDGRRRAVPLLHRARGFIEPHIPTIEQVLRSTEFSESLPEFTAIRSQVPEAWTTWWDDISMRVYLNEQEMKEFEVVDEST